MYSFKSYLMKLPFFFLIGNINSLKKKKYRAADKKSTKLRELQLEEPDFVELL